MSRWWHRRSVKVRLTRWYAAVTLFVVAEAQLDMDDTGRLRWLVRGTYGDEGFARQHKTIPSRSV